MSMFRFAFLDQNILPDPVSNILPGPGLGTVHVMPDSVPNIFCRIQLQISVLDPNMSSGFRRKVNYFYNFLLDKW